MCRQYFTDLDPATKTFNIALNFLVWTSNSA